MGGIGGWLVTGGIVVLGGAGMLGHKLFQVLRERFPGTITTTRENVHVPPLSGVTLLAGPDVLTGVDVVDFEALRMRLEKLAPAGIVNCIGEVATPNAITLRTSIIGRELSEHWSLLDWFLSQKARKVRGFRKVIYSGITTNEMANVVSLIIRSFPTLSRSEEHTS